MIRWEMYKKVSEEVNALILGANMVFIIFGFICVFFKGLLKFEQAGVIIVFNFLWCFIETSSLYRTYLHDIFFKRIEVRNTCIYAQQKFITEDERYSLFRSKKNMVNKQFRLWTQDVDEDGNLKPYDYTCDSWHMYPNGNEFMSFDFKLYEKLEDMIRKIPERRIKEKGKRDRFEKEQLLYVEISYFKSTNMIFDVKVLGKKKRKVR